MARKVLPLTHYVAEMVLMPSPHGGSTVVEALRLVVSGPNFPQRAIEPELLLGEVKAQRVSIATDQRSIRGYFFTVPMDGEAIRVRYGESLEGELRDRFTKKKIRPLATDCGE